VVSNSSGVDLPLPSAPALKAERGQRSKDKKPTEHVAGLIALGKPRNVVTAGTITPPSERGAPSTSEASRARKVIDLEDGEIDDRERKRAKTRPMVENAEVNGTTARPAQPREKTRKRAASPSSSSGSSASSEEGGDGLDFFAKPKATMPFAPGGTGKREIDGGLGRNGGRSGASTPLSVGGTGRERPSTSTATPISVPGEGGRPAAPPVGRPLGRPPPPPPPPAGGKKMDSSVLFIKKKKVRNAVGFCGCVVHAGADGQRSLLGAAEAMRMDSITT
jgi:hypothetical protein